MAEREGFEPSVRASVHLISSQAHSASLAPLRGGEFYYQTSRNAKDETLSRKNAFSLRIQFPEVDAELGKDQTDSLSQRPLFSQ